MCVCTSIKAIKDKMDPYVLFIFICFFSLALIMLYADDKKVHYLNVIRLMCH